MLIFMPGALMTKEAVEDLRGIVVPMAAQNPTRAQRFSNGLNQTVETLVMFPNMGSPRQFADVPIRELRVFPVNDFKMYLVYYHSLASDDGIEILRVLHHRRDAQTLLADDETTDDSP